MAATQRFDRMAPYQEPTYPPGRSLEASGLSAGDRFVVARALSDTRGHLGAGGSVLWTGGTMPFAQLHDGTTLNLLEDDYLENPSMDALRGTIPLITISHDTTMWNEGFEHDVYIQFPAAGLEAIIRDLVYQHNAIQHGYERDFEVSVRMGPWEGPDLNTDEARKIVFEALSEWEGI